MFWVIRYSDESFCADEGPPEAAPLDGVLTITQFPHGSHDKRQEVLQGADYYAWIGGEWASGGQADLDRWIRAGYVHPGVVKFGLWVPRLVYRRVMDEVMAREDCGCGD